MVADPSSRQQLLDEVRRRAGRRRQRRHRVMAGVSVVTVIAVVVLAVNLSAGSGGGKKVQILAPPGGATTNTASSAPSPVPGAATVSGATESDILPVVICPTTFGISPPPAPVLLPGSMKVTIPVSQASQLAHLAVYRDNQGTMELLAPAGWACTAGYGADGSGGVAVYPVGQSLPASWAAGWKLSPSSSVSAIVGVETSACQGCTNGQACPLFTTAASAFLTQLGHTCPDIRPPSETVHSIRAGVVGFQDPAGVSGDGLPSGGQDPANGVMTYYPGNPQGSWLETCTLPAPLKDVCTAVLNQFLTGYGHD